LYSRWFFSLAPLSNRSVAHWETEEKKSRYHPDGLVLDAVVTVTERFWATVFLGHYSWLVNFDEEPTI
jgi:hypothetical protein